MKQYTTPEQTAKLIELGFEKPKSIEKMIPQPVVDGYVHLVPQKAYSIVELIDILMTIKGVRISFDSKFGGRLTLIVKRLVGDKWDILYGNVSKELVDLLFDAIVKLKEKGVI